MAGIFAVLGTLVIRSDAQSYPDPTKYYYTDIGKPDVVPTQTFPSMAEPGFTISTYAANLPVNSLITGMAIDPVTRTLFYAGLDVSPTSPLYRIAPATQATSIVGSFSAPGGYAYIATDIELMGSNIYTFNLGYQLSRISSGANSGTATGVPVFDYSGGNQENGLAAIGSTLYLTGGRVTPGQLYAFDTTLNTATLLNVANLPAEASSLEYSPATGQLYVASNSAFGNPATLQFWSINLQTLTASLIRTGLGTSGAAFGNFAIDPNGQFLYTRRGNVIDRITIATGAVTPFVTGLSDDSGFADMAFGSASSGLGGSLYVGDGNTVREIRGFVHPVPEPAAWLTVSVVLGTVALRRQRRRQ